MRTKNGFECVDYTFDHEHLAVRQDMKVSELAEIVRRIGENWGPDDVYHMKAEELNERFR